MKKSQIEAWTLQIIERVRRGEHVEDARVELKATWVEPKRAARRLAGHANAARGEPILWIVGLHETEGVRPVPTSDYSSWMEQVRACFDSLAPSVTDIAVPTEQGTVVALLFSTSQSPYVIVGPVDTSLEREVPWREATRIRSARRHELLLLLAEQATAPETEPLWALVDLHAPDHNGNNCTLQFGIYVMPISDTRIVLPWHRASIVVNSPVGIQCEFSSPRLEPPQIRGGSNIINVSRTIVSTEREAIIDGAGELVATVLNGRIGDATALRGHSLRLGLSARPVRALTSLDVNIEANYQGEISGSPGTHRWGAGLS